MPPQRVRVRTGISREALLELADGDLGYVAERVEAFRDGAPKRLHELADAAERGDLAEMGEAAERLKSAVGQFGADPAYQAARRVEAIARSGSGRADRLDEACAALVCEVEALLDALSAFAAELER